jgi:hypothetical protein
MTMIIPLEGDRLLLMTDDLVALVRRDDGVTEIIGSKGARGTTGFTPKTLKERHRRLWSRGRFLAASLLQGGNSQ